MSRIEGERAIQKFEESEHVYGREAFKYVASPKERSKLQVGDNQAFVDAFMSKQNKNKETRKKIGIGTGIISVLSGAGGMGLAAAGGMTGPLAFAGAVAAVGMIPIAAAGLGILGGKYLYDKYRERKALKDYSTAFVAKNGRLKLSQLFERNRK